MRGAGGRISLRHWRRSQFLPDGRPGILRNLFGLGHGRAGGQNGSEQSKTECSSHKSLVRKQSSRAVALHGIVIACLERCNPASVVCVNTAGNHLNSPSRRDIVFCCEAWERLHVGIHPDVKEIASYESTTDVCFACGDSGRWIHRRSTASCRRRRCSANSRQGQRRIRRPDRVGPGRQTRFSRSARRVQGKTRRTFLTAS